MLHYSTILILKEIKIIFILTLHNQTLENKFSLNNSDTILDFQMDEVLISPILHQFVEELFGLKINLPFDFPIEAPASSGEGDPPKISQISRSAVSPNQPVGINVTAKDKGAGISNRTYIRASTNNGISWYNYSLVGPAWDNETENGNGLGGYFPQ